MKRSLILCLGLVACVSPPKRVAVPPPVYRPAPPTPAPPPPVAWEDRARTMGNWTWSQGRADFSQGSTILASISCQAGTIQLTRPGVVGALVVRTTTSSRTLAAGQPLAATEPLLDAIAFSRGKWMLASDGQPDLTLPPWPEIARVVEDCRG